jgi:TolA-binding protein
VRLFIAVSIISCLVIVETTQAQVQLSRSKDERLFKKGIELVEHANYGAARQVLSEFIDMAPASDARRAEAEYYIAYCAVNLGHSDGEKLIENFISNNPSNPRSVTAYYDLGNFFYNDKNYNKAIVYYKKVNFSALPLAQQTEGRFRFGYSFFNLKKLDEALEQFNFVKIQNSSYTPAANYYAGFIEYSKGLYEDALTDLKRAESSSAYAPIVPYLIANVYYKQRQYDELIRYADGLKNKASSINNYDDISMLVADAYYYKGDYRNAADAYERFLSENEAKAESALLFRAGYSNYSLGQDAKAVTYLKSCAAKSDSVGYYASYYLGIVYLKQGNKPYAANAFNHATKNTADRNFVEESLFQYAKVMYDQGKAEEAITDFERFLEEFPGSDHGVEVKELLAQAYVNGNNYNKAIEYIESLPSKSTGIQRAYQKASYLKGAELFNKEAYAESVPYFKRSLQYPVEPSYVALAAFWCGEALSLEREFDEAVTYYKQVVAVGSAAEREVRSRVRYSLGYAYFNSKQYGDALTNFQEFVSTADKSPMYADGLIRLADCYYVSKKYTEAVGYYNKARQQGSPDDDYIIYQTGMIQGILMKYAESRSLFTNLISNYPKSTYRDDALYHRAQFEIEQGNYQQAANGFTQLIKEETGSPFIPYAHMRRAASYYNLKDYNKTVDDYVAVVKEYSNHPAAQQVLLPLQEALNLAGRSGEFDQYLKLYTAANPNDKNIEVVQFEAAKAQYFNQQYDRAIGSFSSFLSTYPESSRVPESKYYLADSYYRSNDLGKALPVFQELLSDPAFAMYNRVVARVAEIEFRQGRYEQAVRGYHRMERIAANKKELYNAWSGLMESFFLMAQYDSVTAYANLILEKGNVNAGAQNKASLFLGKAAMAKGDYETAKDEFINTLNSARDEYGAEAKYLLAEIFYQSKQYTQCYETLISLNNDFAAYESWVGKSFLLLADQFVARNEIFQAKETLRSLIEKFPLESVRVTAREKLKKLEEQELLEKAKQEQADSVGNNR